MSIISGNMGELVGVIFMNMFSTFSPGDTLQCSLTALLIISKLSSLLILPSALSWWMLTIAQHSDIARVPGTRFIICTNRVDPHLVVMFIITTGITGSPTASANLELNHDHLQS